MTHEDATKKSALATILIVDDTPANIAVLSSMLLEAGYDVRVATSGKRGLAIAEADAPDLVMLDVDMPGMDGFEVCRRLRASARTARVPVIFLSALDDVTGKVTAFRSGGVDYITKPFQLEEVLARLEVQLRIARLTRALEEGQAALAAQNAELVQKNLQLVAEQKRTDRVFSALSEALLGRVLDAKYDLEEQIGAGGFGVVYRARHVGLGRHVAVKVFRPAPGNDTRTGLARFQREGLAACRLEHPNVARVFDSGLSEGGIAYLVMELLTGHPLSREIARHGRLPPARVAQLLVPVCGVLAEAAARGLVHRDIKPDNVFLHVEDGVETVKVLDFGIAKLLTEPPPGDESLTRPGSILGSPAYMSPERLLGNPCEPSADVYGVGVMMYQMLSGRLPFQPEGNSFTAIALQYLTESPPPLDVPDLPEGLEALVLSAMCRQPGGRPSAAALGQALSGMLGDGGQMAPVRVAGAATDVPTVVHTPPSGGDGR